MRYLTLFLTIFLLLSSASINAGTIDPAVPDSKYLSYGSKHECVVEIHTTQDAGDKVKIHGSASAVIITPDIVLTAAHVVVGTKNAKIILKNGEAIEIESYVFPKLFIAPELNNHSSAYDIAVCKLKKSAKIDFYPSLYSENDEVGKVCSIAGFGFSGKYNTNVFKNDRKKRAGSNIIDTIIDDTLICSVGKGQETSLEFMINSGDSGGGLFIDKKLAGINSAIYKINNNNIFDHSRHVRVSLHKNWIDSIIKLFDKIDEFENSKNVDLE